MMPLGFCREVCHKSGGELWKCDTVRELSSFYSMVSSDFLRAWEKTMLYLPLSEWLEWKCRSAAQSVGFL